VKATLDLVHSACGKPADLYRACAQLPEPLIARDVLPTVP
jgi:hypothetical protein